MKYGKQIRAARAFLDFSREELASRSGISLETIRRVEREGLDRATMATVRALESAFFSEGIRFTDSGGLEPVPGQRDDQQARV